MGRLAGLIAVFTASLDMGVHPTAAPLRATVEVLGLIIGGIMVMGVFESE